MQGFGCELGHAVAANGRAGRECGRSWHGPVAQVDEAGGRVHVLCPPGEQAQEVLITAHHPAILHASAFALQTRFHQQATIRNEIGVQESPAGHQAAAVVGCRLPLAARHALLRCCTVNGRPARMQACRNAQRKLLAQALVPGAPVLGLVLPRAACMQHVKVLLPCKYPILQVSIPRGHQVGLHSTDQ